MRPWSRSVFVSFVSFASRESARFAPGPHERAVPREDIIIWKFMEARFTERTLRDVSDVLSLCASLTTSLILVPAGFRRLSGSRSPKLTERTLRDAYMPWNPHQRVMSTKKDIAPYSLK
jgi:hypothetical protein